MEEIRAETQQQEEKSPDRSFRQIYDTPQVNRALPLVSLISHERWTQELHFHMFLQNWQVKVDLSLSV